MSITKNHDGAIIISDVIRGYLVSRTYYGFTRKEALAMFKLETIQN